MTAAALALPVPLDDPDPGLFGPDSITWRVHNDPAMVLGGLRALLLQALHPLAMAGVAQHSGFQSDPWGRLFRTAEYVATVTYGTAAEAERAGAIVQAVHRHKSGVEPESGLPYRVDDPHLLRWVHCAEVDSFLAAYQRTGGALTRAEADAYLAEQTLAAENIGVDPTTVPASVAALRRYYADIRPELRATAEAFRAARFVLAPPMPPQARPARPAWLVVATVAFGLLPPWARRLYGPAGFLTGHPGIDLAAGLSGAALSAALRLLPHSVRDSPVRKAALARVGRG